MENQKMEIYGPSKIEPDAGWQSLGDKYYKL